MKDKKPRILHAYKTYYPEEGGIPTVIQNIAEGLHTQTVQNVLCMNHRFKMQKENIHGVEVTRLPSFGEVLSLPLSPQFPFAFWQAAQNHDVVVYHFPMPWVDVSVAGYFPRHTKLIVHWHSDIVRQKRAAQLLSPFIDRCLARADHIIIADEANLTPRLHPYREKCSVMPYGVETQKWQVVNAVEKEKIQHYRHTFGQFVLGVGRLVSYKGFEVLIKAFVNIEANLVIVGQGPLEQELKTLAHDLGISHKVHLVGKMDEADLKALYYAAEVFAFPSIQENEAFGMVQVEAMACQNAVVNTALQSGVPSVARHEKEALTVPPGDSEALAIALKRLLQDDTLRNRLAQAGLARVNSEYSMETFLERTLNLYTSL